MDRNEFACELENLFNRSEALYLGVCRWKVESKRELKTKKRLLDFMVTAADSLFEAKSIIELMEPDSENNPVDMLEKCTMQGQP